VVVEVVVKLHRTYHFIHVTGHARSVSSLVLPLLVHHLSCDVIIIPSLTLVIQVIDTVCIWMGVPDATLTNPLTHSPHHTLSFFVCRYVLMYGNPYIPLVCLYLVRARLGPNLTSGIYPHQVLCWIHLHLLGPLLCLFFPLPLAFLSRDDSRFIVSVYRLHLVCIYIYICMYVCMCIYLDLISRTLNSTWSHRPTCHCPNNHPQKTKQVVSHSVVSARTVSKPRTSNFGAYRSLSVRFDLRKFVSIVAFYTVLNCPRLD